MRILIILLVSAGILSFISISNKEAPPRVTNLRCEYLPDPQGIDVVQPRLSWELVSHERGVVQQAYRIQVASSLAQLEKGTADLWDSQKIISSHSLNIRYAGKPLSSRSTCYWKVKIWTKDGKETAWSNPAQWSMGLLQPADWSARWIGLDTFFAPEQPHAVFTRLAARYLRKDFTVAKKIKQAKVYISGLGLYELYINGEKIGNQVLAPGPTQYEKKVFYNCFDVTDKITPGKNAIGTILGNGRFFAMRSGQKGMPAITNYGYPKMLLQLELTYEDNSTTLIASDPSWKITAAGPILANNEFDGEEYDANKEMPGWNKAGFDDAKWLPVQSVKAPGGRLTAQMNEPIRVMDSIQPVAIKEIKPGTFVFDMGQNMVGWARLKMNGKKGDTITLRFAERLNDDGTLYTANLRSAKATDQYIMKGGEESWEPRFTYHGFRYVEMTGFPGKPGLQSLQGRVVYDALATTGHFETSNPVINQIYKNAYWGIRGNYRGMPTDCPQRDERMGWLGDRAVGSHGESFIFDNNKLYAKWLNDIEDAQTPEGSIPDVAPTYWKIYSDNMTWPGAYLIIANMLYQQFGNLQPIYDHYASMKKWMDYMRDKYMKNYILTKDTYGDWCMPPESPELIHSKDPARKTAGDYLATAFYYHLLTLMQRFAVLTSHQQDEQEFATLAAHIKTAFNEKFLQKSNSQYANNTATANLFALAYQMAPQEIRQAVFQNVVHKTLQDFKGHISTGLVGAQWLMRVLSDNGRPDIAYKLATNTDYPSWGYMAQHGATTIWELWNGNTADPAMNSGNHVMLLGDLIVWYYEYLAGIQSDPAHPGFKRILMRPTPVGDLTHVKADYQSVHGRIASEWKIDHHTFHWQISVPANTTALVYIPARTASEVKESGKTATAAKAVHFLRMENGRALFELGSGSYDFSVPYQGNEQYAPAITQK